MTTISFLNINVHVLFLLRLLSFIYGQRHATYVLTGDVFLKKEKLSCLMMAAVNGQYYDSINVTRLVASALFVMPNLIAIP
jgi:hypothetical protein